MIGDIYDIDFIGPDNGSLMLVERTPTHFVFQTIKIPNYGYHPESGSREFGFEQNSDGSIKFYTRGYSQGYTGMGDIITTISDRIGVFFNHNHGKL